jgi:hypothetical protein
MSNENKLTNEARVIADLEGNLKDIRRELAWSRLLNMTLMGVVAAGLISAAAAVTFSE